MTQPIRVIDGNTQPFEPFWAMRDSAEGDGIEVEFDGPISEYSWLGDEITPAMFKKELYEKGGGKPVTVLVNSPGGEVIAASVIRSILQEYPGKVTADVVGLAASAATIVITGADHIRMRESALMMIHDPSMVAWGTIDEIKKAVDVLETVKSGILDTYETKTGRSRDELSRMMKKVTWMTAHEALENGFIDEVVTGSVKKAPKNQLRAGFLNCLNSIEISAEARAILEEEEEPNHEPEVEIDPTTEGTKSSADDKDEQMLRNYLDVFGTRSKS